VPREQGRRRASRLCAHGAPRARAQVRESLYQALGIIASQAAGFFAAGADARALWAPALVGSLEHMPMTHVRILIRHVMLPLCRHCPPAHRRALSPARSRRSGDPLCLPCKSNS